MGDGTEAHGMGDGTEAHGMGDGTEVHERLQFRLRRMSEHNMRNRKTIR